jgi:hypothetical protein
MHAALRLDLLSGREHVKLQRHFAVCALGVGYVGLRVGYLVWFLTTSMAPTMASLNASSSSAGIQYSSW